MNIKSIGYRFLVILGMAFALAACSDEGPMEKAGEKIDDTAEQTQNAVEDSCENVKESLDVEDQDC